MPIGNKTLLCIDRDPSALRIQKGLLRENGYEVVTATSGFDGLGVLNAMGVDAIILSSCVNLLESFVLAVALKQVRSQVPIVFVTESVQLPAGASAAVDALVTRSNDPQVLLSTLQSVLGAQAAPIASANDGAPPNYRNGLDRPRVLNELRTLVDTFSPGMRERILAEVRPVFAALAQQFHESVAQRPHKQVHACPDPAPDAAA
jgi:DNA-binding response OmpR family regulator